MSEPLEDLKRRWAEEARERAELDGAVDVADDLADDEAPVDPDVALRELRHQPDDDQPTYRAPVPERDR